MIKIVVSVKARNIRDAYMNSNNNFVFIFHRVLAGNWNSVQASIYIRIHIK
jgi:hypothetical protein